MSKFDVKVGLTANQKKKLKQRAKKLAEKLASAAAAEAAADTTKGDANADGPVSNQDVEMEDDEAPPSPVKYRAELPATPPSKKHNNDDLQEEDAETETGNGNGKHRAERLVGDTGSVSSSADISGDVGGGGDLVE